MSWNHVRQEKKMTIKLLFYCHRVSDMSSLQIQSLQILFRYLFRYLCIWCIVIDIKGFPYSVMRWVFRVYLVPPPLRVLFPPASAVEGIKLVPSVCVCLSVCEPSHGWTVWHTDVTWRRDVLTSLDDFWAKVLAKRASCGRARQHSGIFIDFRTKHKHFYPTFEAFWKNSSKVYEWCL